MKIQNHGARLLRNGGYMNQAWGSNDADVKVPATMYRGDRLGENFMETKWIS